MTAPLDDGIYHVEVTAPQPAIDPDLLWLEQMFLESQEAILANFNAAQGFSSDCTDLITNHGGPT